MTTPAVTPPFATTPSLSTVVDAIAVTNARAPSLGEAVEHLVAAQDVLLGLWFCELPDLATQRAAVMCAAHRSVHDAMLVLDDRAGAVLPPDQIGAHAAH